MVANTILRLDEAANAVPPDASTEPGRLTDLDKTGNSITFLAPSQRQNAGVHYLVHTRSDPQAWRYPPMVGIYGRLALVCRSLGRGDVMGVRNRERRHAKAKDRRSRPNFARSTPIPTAVPPPDSSAGGASAPTSIRQPPSALQSN